MRRIFTLFLCAVILLTLLVPTALAVPGVSARSFVLLDAGTRTVLAEQNADTQMLIASTTKIMTAALALEHASMDDIVEILPEYTGIEGSSMYLRAGESMTVGDLLYGLMLSSGNDAAVALAYHVAGGIDAFAALMNEKAAALGMTNSNFQNPHGLDGDAHYSTARDMAILTAWAMESEAFAQVAGTRSTQAAGRSLVNHNKLLWRYPDAEGVKTGFTKAAGRSLVSSACRDGTRLICVTLSAPDDWDDHHALLDWGFANYKYHQILVQGAEFAQVPVISGTADSVALAPEQGLALLLHPDDLVTVTAHVPRHLFAGVNAGEQGGTVMVAVNGQPTFETRLLYSESVALDETNRLGFWEEIQWNWNMLWK